mmetsp:Transcript_28639/g.53713  ORF Transcript_28639/g.53713 Transcript_28639/m.53713 type:complete len:241 (-) Transcript_28639:189-911(-)
MVMVAIGGMVMTTTGVQDNTLSLLPLLRVASVDHVAIEGKANQRWVGCRRISTVVRLRVQAVWTIGITMVMVVFTFTRVCIAFIHFATHPRVHTTVVVVWEHGHTVDGHPYGSSCWHPGHVRQRIWHSVASAGQLRRAERHFVHVQLRSGSAHAALRVASRRQRNAMQVDGRGSLSSIVLSSSICRDNQILVIAPSSLHVAVCSDQLVGEGGAKAGSGLGARLARHETHCSCPIRRVSVE